MSLSIHQSISPTQIGITAELYLKDHPHLVPTYFGQGGLGKSQIAKQVADNLGCDEFVVINPQFMDIVDFMGIPSISERDGVTVTTFTAPDFVQRILNAKNPFVFIDEATMGDEGLQGLIMSLALDKKSGDHQLPKDTRIMVCANREEDGSVFSNVPAPLMDRYKPFNVAVSAQDAIDHGVAKGWHPEVISYLRNFPDAINKGWNVDFAKSATPRGFDHLQSFISKTDIPPSLELPIIQSFIGKAYGDEFVAFRRIYRDLPDREEIYSNPSSATVVDRYDVNTALATMLSYFAEDKNIDATITYLRRLPKEFQIICIADMHKAKPQLTKGKAFVNWVTEGKNMELFTDA
jgi:hypothetical protein